MGAWAASPHAAVDSSCLLIITSTLLLQIFKKVGLSAIRLLFIPGVVEAFFDGALAIAFFNMPATFAFALGFILKAVGPALVIQCMFEVQQKRLGVAKCEDMLCSTHCLLAAVPLLWVCSISLFCCQLPGLHIHDVHQNLPTLLLCLSVCAACSITCAFAPASWLLSPS